MKKSFLLINLFILSNTFYGYTQTDDFIRIHSNVITVESGPYKDFMQYHFEDLDFYFGGKEFTKIVKVTKNDKIIYSIIDSISDVMNYEPTLFRDINNSDVVILMIESGTEFTWGQNVLLIENGITHECGYIGYGINVDNGSSIAPITHFKRHNKIIEIWFDNVELFNCDNLDETIMGSQLKFKITDYKLEKIKN
jgi:hypothetical protein